ncbi:MAG: FAD-dependent oxidoreductase [Pseudomonadota bacterium]
MRIAVIGAGLAGVTAARALADAGLSPVIFDKGRGIGGRLATRRGDGGFQFDHGAQYLPADSSGFAAVLERAKAAGVAVPWTLDDGRDVVVGTPGMNALPKYLAQGLDVRQEAEIDAIRKAQGGWSLAGSVFDRVICTVPAPQAMRLVAEMGALCDALSVVVMDPNLTLMLALPAEASPSFAARSDLDDSVAWLACNSSKPDRPGPGCYVAQASLAWSKAHLELEKSEIAERLLPSVCHHLGVDASDAIYVAGHRWRYAQASKPLAQPYLSADETLFLGGDWALSGRAEGAWQSGQAMAEAVLASR